MSDFNNIRAQLNQQRAAHDTAASQLNARRERLKNIERELADRKRRADKDDPAGLQRIKELETESATLTAEVAQRRDNLAGLKSDTSALLGELVALADPTKQIEALHDAFPILFFPLRIETRFKTIANAAGQSKQLWVRVYPDDCQVDSFEEMLTDAEVTSARSFWTGMWQAGGFEAQERGAWATLVGSYGSGRAAWITSQYAPLNAKPTKAKAEDFILVFIPQLAVSPQEEGFACKFWMRVWQADGDHAEEDAALAQFKLDVNNDARVAELVEKYRPENLGQNPPSPHTRQSVTVICATLAFDPNQPAVTKTTSWTQAPRARALPDRLVLLCFNGGTQVKQFVGRHIPDGLATGPDPSLPEAEQIKLLDGDLVINDDLRWMVDFDHAVEVGMGFKLDLTADEAQHGFDRMYVLGVRLSSDEQGGRVLLESLLSNHYHSKHGFGLVPQGSPTNNTEGEGAAHTWIDDPDASYDLVFKGQAAFTPSTDSFERRDGEWLAAALGIAPDIMQRAPHGGGRDQGEARAMNTALWPATLGYFMEEMMQPLFAVDTIELTRRFFNTYVSGRGPLPAIRIGRQPYGILPAMAGSRYAPTPQPDSVLTKQFLFTPLYLNSAYLTKLHKLLRQLDAQWQTLSAQVAHVGQPGADPHQTLLDVIGLHSGSVEFHQRYAESLQHIYNQLVMQFGVGLASLLADWLRQRGQQIFAELGFIRMPEVPILEKFFFGHSPLLSGPIVDDVPLSESLPVRAYSADKQNYLAWLATATTDTIRMQNFGGNPTPTALLYLLLRHAMLLGHWDAGIRMLEARALVESAVVRQEPAFINVQTQAQATGVSKFQHLYETAPLVTGDNQTTLAEYIMRPAVLANAFETRDVRDMVKALKFLQDTPTARLERLFSEHLDCCSYRLDAWQTGLAAARLEELRALPPPVGANNDPAGGPVGGANNDPAGGPGKGVYLGAYGWLENVRPEARVLTPPTGLSAELNDIFQRPGQPPLVVDDTNAGYIHAPSLNHATTAAILKNAYIVNASEANREPMSVNLSSARVRQALALLEGIRNGQSLAALLGYRFERGLHDRHTLVEVDKFIYPLRQAFPLVADKLKPTKSDGQTDIKLAEARNVIDGVRLINHMREHNQPTYPFGLPTGNAPGQLPFANADELKAITAEVDAMLDLHDAVADTVLAESVHQVVLGNFDRAAANTQAFAKGKYPPEPDVVRTPRSGLTLTHRVALHLDAAINPNVSPSAVPMTPRATAEAPLNEWLAAHLPDPLDVVCVVAYKSPALAGEKQIVVTQADLGLQPVDLLYLHNLELEQAMAELDGRIVQLVRYEPTLDPHPALTISIRYTEPVADKSKVTLFELAALLKSLRALLLQSRHVAPTDMSLPLDAEASAYTYDFAEFETRITTAAGELTMLRDNQLGPLEVDGADLDAYARKVSQAFLQAALYGVPQTGTSDIHDSIAQLYHAILAKITELTLRWDAKSAEFAALMALYPTLTTDDDRFKLLTTAEGVIQSTTTTVLPPDPNTFKLTVEGEKLTFDAHLLDFKNLLTASPATLVDFVAAVDLVAPAAATHDAVPLDIAAQKQGISTLRADLVARVTGLKQDLTERIAAANAALPDAATTAEPEARVRLMLQAAAHVLGDEIKLLPRFKLADVQGLELQNCVNDAAVLQTYLQTDKQRLFPVDDWLYGVARVRPKLYNWENTVFLTEAFGKLAPALTPLQLPFRADDRWLALDFPPDYVFDGERLLYTAHFASVFNPNAVQCGLLLDEWTEVVPAQEEMTGLTFNFDRPNSEPPQVLLLAVPPRLTGHWHWADIVAMLDETLAAAKQRAVDPAQLAATNYAQFLPATLMAVTLYQLSIATNLAVNNGIYQKIG